MNGLRVVTFVGRIIVRNGFVIFGSQFCAKNKVTFFPTFIVFKISFVS